MVIAIIGILYSVSIPAFQNTVSKARETALKDNLHSFRKSINDYYSYREKYPETLNSLVEEKFIRSIPEDPVTGKREWKIELHPQGGIYNVYSESDRISSEGTMYSSW